MLDSWMLHFPLKLVFKSFFRPLQVRTDKQPNLKQLQLIYVCSEY